MKNLSQRPLSTTECEVLALGLNYTITPKSLPVFDIITSIEKAAEILPQETAHDLKTEVKKCLMEARPPKPNLSSNQRQALKTLKEDDSIVQLPADKGNVTVVLGRDTYDLKLRHLLDDDSYVKIDSDPTNKIEKKVNSKLRKLFESGEINKTMYGQDEDYVQQRSPTLWTTKDT